MLMKDCLTLDASGLTRTKDGYLVGQARVSRAGNVQTYLGREMGLTGDDAGKSFGVYRDPDTVFDEASMLSLAGRPVTRGHPPAGVDAKTWRDLAVGHLGARVVRDGEHVVAPMAIMDAAAVAEVEAGARALSAGYTVAIVADEGVAPDGTAYQFRQAGPLRFNHVAYLPDNNPRAGNTRIGDDASAWGASPIPVSDQQEDPMSDTLKTVVLGDKAVQIAAADAPTLDAYKAAEAKRLADAQATHDAAMALKDAALAKAEAERDAAQAKVLTDAALDARVAARASLVATARRIVGDVTTDGLSDAAIRKAVVAAKIGDAATGKSDAYIDARFDVLAEDAGKADPVANAMLNAPVNLGDAKAQAEAARHDYHAALRDAWKAPAGQH